MSDMNRHGFEAVEAEIRREKAEALGRTGERLERILHVDRQYPMPAPLAVVGAICREDGQ